MEAIQFELSTVARQFMLSRRFREPQLERRYREHAFRVGMRRVVPVVLLFITLEAYIVVTSLMEKLDNEEAWSVGDEIVACRFAALSILLAALALLLSKHNRPSRLPLLLWVTITSYVVTLVAPKLANVLRSTPPAMVDACNLSSGNQTVDDFEESVLTGGREHDASWVAGCWYLAAVATAVCGDSWGMLGPAGSITLFWIAVALHATTMALAYEKTPSSARGQFGVFVPHMVAAGCINAYLAWACCEASRQMFLASALTSIQREEQLSREKERLDYERRFAEMRLCLAKSGAAGQHGDPGSQPAESEAAAGAVEAAAKAAAPASHGGSESRLSRSDVPSSSSTNVEVAALTWKMGRSVNWAQPWKLRTLLQELDAGSSMSAPSPSKGETVQQQVEPVHPLHGSDPDATTASPDSSGSFGLVELRHELQAARSEVQARKAAAQTLSETGADIGASLSDGASSAGSRSVATSATAADLQLAFETEQRKQNGTIAAMSRPKKGGEHPLRAFVLALYGQRPPGPMPGQMPPDMETMAEP